MEHPISLTTSISTRLKKLSEEGVVSQNFNPTKVDWIRNSFSVSQSNNHVINNSFRGFMRLIEDEGFISRQKSLLTRRLHQYDGLGLRFLVKTPDNFPHMDELRDKLAEIQVEARSPEIYLPVGKNESFESISEYLNNFNSAYSLILDLGMDSLVFREVLENLGREATEIVFLFDDIKKNRENFNFMIEMAERGLGSNFHVSGVPVDFNQHGKLEPIALLLICSGIKSIGIVETPIPAYIFPHIDRSKPAKTAEEKLVEAMWIDSEGIGYVNEHPSNCECMSSEVFDNLIRNEILKETQTFHALEKLSGLFARIRGNESERRRILELEPLRDLREAISLT